MPYKNLVALRERLGMNQKTFAATLGIKPNTYNNYETGFRNPNTDFFELIAKKYSVSVDYLLGLTDDPTPYNRAIKKPAPNSESELNIELIEMLSHFTPDEAQRLVDFAKGIVAAHKA